MTKRDVDREAVEDAAMRLAAAVMRHDLTLDQFWEVLRDPVAAEKVTVMRTVSVNHGPD